MVIEGCICEFLSLFWKCDLGLLSSALPEVSFLFGLKCQELIMGRDNLLIIGHTCSVKFAELSLIKRRSWTTRDRS